MEPWYKIVTPRPEVREGRSFNPDEFAIALEQVVAGTAPDDYRKPEQFFARTCWTRALKEHVGMVVRRLAGRTDNTASVLTLVTQFGGGKTHTLTALYHLGKNGERAITYPGVADVLRSAGLATVPRCRVAVFVGNAWDPQEGRETPWLDLAWQLAGEQGVQALGPAAKTVPPGTEALGRLFQAANAPVLILFDEVLNFVNRHRSLAEPFHAFIQNLTVALTGTTHGVAVISLPRSQVEMTEWDLMWQERITKVVRRVAKDLIVNDESEISEVVRRRLFEDLGPEHVRQQVAQAFADWCFERRAQLPPEWTAVDVAATEAHAREFLRQRFAACYPFHPATLSVFQRKWQSLSQYQQTRGTLAMLAQWVSWAYREDFTTARKEPLITLGSAPLHDPGFRSVVLGQLGEPRLATAIEADIAGPNSHARALDSDTRGLLAGIHRRVGTAVFFESTGGQVSQVAHLPELRFAIGEPGIDTTSIDAAIMALEERAYYLRRVGSDGYQVHYKAKLQKVVNDLRASLDEATDIQPAMRELVAGEFRRGAPWPPVLFPKDSTDIPDSPRLTLVLLDPQDEWNGNEALRRRIAEWTARRGNSSRLYPAAIVWCVKKPGTDLRNRVELWLAWQRVAQDLASGALTADVDPNEGPDVPTRVRAAKEAAQDEVWASYRFVVVFDPHAADGLRVIDLGAGHSSSAESLFGRVVSALKSEGLLSESVGAGYIDRHWPPALVESGAWPLAGLRQSFLNGTLTRLIDPENVLRRKIVEFVEAGEFGLASGSRPDGTYNRVWFNGPVSEDEVEFTADVYLLRKERAKALTEAAASAEAEPAPPCAPVAREHSPMYPAPEGRIEDGAGPSTDPTPVTLRITGSVPPEVWNRLGTRLIAKLRQGGVSGVRIGIDIEVTADGQTARQFVREVLQALHELGLHDQVDVISGS